MITKIKRPANYTGPQLAFHNSIETLVTYNLHASASGVLSNIYYIYIYVLL